MRRSIPTSIIAIGFCLALLGCDRNAATSAPSAGATSSDGQAMQAAPATPSAPATSAELVSPPALENLLKPTDTLADAKARLGEGNVIARELAGAEGETFEGWVLYPDEPLREIEVLLDEAGTHPVALRINAPNSAWKRGDGVRIGTTTAELQTMNGKPFKFYGFEWDYGGAITDWNGGAMAPENTSRGGVRLCPPEETEAPPTDYPSGDQEFSSDDPRLVAHPAVVCEFMVNLGE